MTFPDDEWIAEAVVGKNLAANHCDDVVEGWEPEPLVAARWPLTSGTLQFDLPEETACGASGEVLAELEDGPIVTESICVSLPDLFIVNESFGCFAG